MSVATSRSTLGGARSRIRQLDLLEELDAAAPQVDVDQLVAFLDRLDGLGAAIDAYASPELVLDDLLLRWPRTDPTAEPDRRPMTIEPQDERLHAIIRGTVQGVGFRWFVQRVASSPRARWLGRQSVRTGRSRWWPRARAEAIDGCSGIGRPASSTVGVEAIRVLRSAHGSEVRRATRRVGGLGAFEGSGTGSRWPPTRCARS